MSVKVEENSIRGGNSEAVESAKGAYRVGIQPNEVMGYYDKWVVGGVYDEHLCPERYSGPEACCRAMAKHFPESERANIRVLDVAAGTGRVGVELYKIGFRTIDALDPSEGMLAKAKEHGVYTSFYKTFIDQDNQVPVTDGAYDALTVSGGFGEGHIPLTALYEMIRVVRKGGLLCMAMREEYAYAASEYKGKFFEFFKKLEQSGHWQQISTETIPNYFCEKPGLLFSYVVV